MTINFEKKQFKDKKIDINHIAKADKLGLSTSEYITYLEELVKSSKTRSDEIALQRLDKVEGLLSNLIQAFTSKDIAERSLVLKLEKDMAQVMVNNKQTQELILSKFEFINALHAELSK